MRFGNKVKHLRLLGEHQVSVSFRDGFVGEVDLWPLFEKPHGPLIRDFHQTGFFEQAYLDHGTLSWPNGYDICSDVLRYYCELGRVAKPDELETYFAIDPQPAGDALTLNDKPNP